MATGGIGAACVPGLIAATAGGALIGVGGDVGNGTPSASVALYSMKTNAPSIDNLTGWGFNIGGSVCGPLGPVPVFCGLDLNILPNFAENENDQSKTYVGLTSGIGVGVPGYETHGGLSYTKNVNGTKFNVFDMLKFLYKKIMEW